MIDKERTDELTQKAKESYKIYSEDKCVDTYEGYQYIDGYLNGCAEGFHEGYKKATERAYERQKDLTNTYIKDGEKIKNLGIEIEELKAQIEKMECCGNCKHREDCVYENAWDLCDKWELAE